MMWLASLGPWTGLSWTDLTSFFYAAQFWLNFPFVSFWFACFRLPCRQAGWDWIRNFRNIRYVDVSGSATSFWPLLPNPHASGLAIRGHPESIPTSPDLSTSLIFTSVSNQISLYFFASFSFRLLSLFRQDVKSDRDVALQVFGQPLALIHILVRFYSQVVPA